MEKNQQSQQPNIQQQMDQVLQQPGQAQPVQPMQPMNGPAKKKKKCNVPALVLAVVAVLGVGAGAYFGVQYFGEKDRADKLAQQNATVATAETTETESGEVAEAASNQASYGFDIGKIANGASDRYTLWDNAVGIELSLDTKQQDTLNLAFLNDGEAYGNYGLAKSSTAARTIKFSKKIGDFKICKFGQAVGDEVIVVILEDGTMEYIPIYSMLKEQKYSSYGAIDGISGAVKFYQVNDQGVSTMVQTTDGKIYNLHTVFEEAKVLQ